jgi:hypothetical protein
MKQKKNKVWDAEQQRKYVARLRTESCLDVSVPLGTTPPPAPEFGPTAFDYYTAKKDKGQYFNLNPYYEAE